MDDKLLTKNSVHWILRLPCNIMKTTTAAIGKYIRVMLSSSGTKSFDGRLNDDRSTEDENNDDDDLQPYHTLHLPRRAD